MTIATRRGGAIWAASLAGSLVLGLVVVRWGPAIGLGLLLLPLVGYVLTRRLGPLLLAVLIVATIPYWRYLGPVHSIRIACALPVLAWLVGRRPRLSWIDVTLGLFVLIAVLGWYLQDDQPAATTILVSEFAPLTFFLGARAVPPAKVRVVLTFLFLAGTLGALTVLYEAVAGHLVFGQSAETYYWNASTATVFRPGGIFGSPPGAATVLAMTAVCGLPVLRSWRGWRRAAAGACMLITLAAMVSTFTRAPLIGFGAATVLYLFVSRSRLLRPAPIVAALLVVLVGAVFVLPRLESNSLFEKGIVRGGTFAARVGYWDLALPIVTANTKNLLFGIGTEATVVTSEGGSAPPSLAGSTPLTTNGTHNEYVLTLLEEGIVGLASLVAWLAVSIVAGVRSAYWRRDPFAAALPAAVLALAIVLLADNSLFDASTMAILGLVTGLTVARRSGPAVVPHTAELARGGAIAPGVPSPERMPVHAS